jgi:hypothetical protein
MNPAMLCISTFIGLILLFTISVGIALRAEKPIKEDLKSAAMVHWQFTPKQWYAWRKLEWSPAEKRLRKVISNPFTWVLVLLVVVPLLVLPVVAYTGEGWWLALITFALLMIVPFAFFFGYRWISISWIRFLRMSRHTSGEVWLGQNGICDSAGLLDSFSGKDQYLAKVEIRVTPYGPALFLEKLAFMDNATVDFPSRIYVREYTVPIPEEKESEAELLVTGLKRSPYPAPHWVQYYKQKQGNRE